MPKIVKTHQLPQAAYPITLLYTIDAEPKLTTPSLGAVTISPAATMELLIEMTPCYTPQNHLSALELRYNQAVIYTHHFAITPSYPSDLLFTCGGHFSASASLSQIEQLYCPHGEPPTAQLSKADWLSHGLENFLPGNDHSLLMAIEFGLISYQGLVSYRAQKCCRDSRFLTLHLRS